MLTSTEKIDECVLGEWLIHISSDFMSAYYALNKVIYEIFLWLNVISSFYVWRSVKLWTFFPIDVITWNNKRVFGDQRDFYYDVCDVIIYNDEPLYVSYPYRQGFELYYYDYYY